MAAITIKKMWFDRACGKKQPTETIAEKLPLLGVTVEGIDDDNVTVEILANRPDLLAGPLLAKAYAKFQGIGQGLKQIQTKPSQYAVIVEQDAAEVRPFTACAVVKGLTLSDDLLKEIIQVQEKLHATVCRNRKKAAIGIYPMEAISWPITYTAEKPENIRFTPLESREMTADRILETHPAGKTYGYLLENAKKYPVFKDARGEVLSMPPIINSEKTGRVALNTKDIFVECSGFDHEFLNSLLCIIVAMLEEVGGIVHNVAVQHKHKKYSTPDLVPVKTKIDVAYINRRLGTAYSDDEVGKALMKMGHSVENGTVFSPRWRTDILHQVDLAEDAAIATGYDKLEPDMSLAPSVGEENQKAVFNSKIAGILSGLCMLEASTYHISSEKSQGERMLSEEKGIALSNALTADYSALRTWLLPSLMEVLATNTGQEYPQRFFAIGTVFIEDEKQETGVREESRLSVAITHSAASLTEARQVFDRVLTLLQAKSEVRNGSHPSCIEGRAGELFVNGKSIGWFGELHPQVLCNWNLRVPAVAGELNLDALFSFLFS